jgi:predicted ATP-grasp superfamily ATP-dependent carboligase
MEKLKTVVALSGTAPGSVISIFKNVKKYNVETISLCYSRQFARLYAQSKYIDKSFFVDNQRGCEGIMNFIEENLSFHDENKPLLYFTNDVSCNYIIERRDWFEDRFELVLPSSTIVRTFNNKVLADIEARKQGLKLPQTIHVGTMEDLNFVKENFKFPIILKPISVEKRSYIGFKTKIIETQELMNISEETLLSKNLLIQEYIPGDDDKSWFYLFFRDDNGTIIDCMGKKIMQVPRKNGIMAKGKTVYNENLATLARKFLADIGYHGIGGIEFKYMDNSFYFIEMSPRTEGFIAISDMAGVSLVDCSYRYLNGLENQAFQQKEGIIYYNFLKVLFERLNKREIIFLLKDIFQMIFNRRYKVDTFSLQDMSFFIKNIFKNKLYQ